MSRFPNASTSPDQSSTLVKASSLCAWTCCPATPMSGTGDWQIPTGFSAGVNIYQMAYAAAVRTVKARHWYAAPNMN